MHAQTQFVRGGRASGTAGAAAAVAGLYARRRAANKRLEAIARGAHSSGRRLYSHDAEVGGGGDGGDGLPMPAAAAAAAAHGAAGGALGAGGEPVIQASALSEEEQLALEIGLLLLQEKQAAKAMHAATERVEEHLRRGVFIPLTFANEKDPPKSPAQRQQQEMPLMSYI